MEKLTPLMQQYWSIKSAHKDQLVFFRMGDFYELFHDDARTAAPILNIALTSRNKKNADETAMCGVPHHSVAGPINKLLKAGFRVAICDQVEDPATAKGIVKRAVTRILSPGMVYDPNTLAGSVPNYICAFDKNSISFLDASTGEAFYFLGNKSISNLIEVLRPIEIVVPVGKKSEYANLDFISGVLVTEHDCQTVSNSDDIPKTAKLLISYAQYMQGEEVLSTLRKFERRETSGCLDLSPTVIRHLEIFETYLGDEQGSLCKAIDRTKTSSGSRLLRSWLRFPSTKVEKINQRLNNVEFWKNQVANLKKLREQLGLIGDLERRLGKISNPSCNPRDILSLASSLDVAVSLSSQFNELYPKFINITKIGELSKLLLEAINEEPPISTSKGGVIKRGFNGDLDELIELTDESEQCLYAIENREKEATGISSLKVRFNNVFGYYIEITKTHLSKIPPHYNRRQTLAGAERFITDELQELEGKILSARGKRIELEAQIFSELKKSIILQMTTLLELAQFIAELDVTSSLAWLAIESNFVRPVILESGRLKLIGSRHPVVEQTSNKLFIANDLEIGFGDCRILTGPNMAGKSTLMRQVAVSVLLAQMGSFVPAREAEIPVFEKIFTRIGASDFLSKGLSTFMVEMSETAEMLKSADDKSLVILDEIGRGTSTYDGLSLAQAILEHLYLNTKSMILFATHYHELTALALVHDKIENYHMSIHEKNGEMRFLYLLNKGAASKSYGIDVAKLAGIPAAVISRSKQLLKDLEKNSSKVSSSQLSLSDLDFQPVANPMLEEIKQLNIQDMTPLEALNKLSQWQQNFL